MFLPEFAERERRVADWHAPRFISRSNRGYRLNYLIANSQCWPILSPDGEISVDSGKVLLGTSLTLRPSYRILVTGQTPFTLLSAPGVAMKGTLN